MDGYIVVKSGDSLLGQIDYRDWGTNPDHITFRRTATDKSQVMGTAEIQAFGVGSDRYETHTVHIFPYTNNPEQMSNETVGAEYDTTVFLQVAVSGKLTLWEFRETTGTDYYFISGKAGKPEQLRVITRLVSEDGSTRYAQEARYKNQLAFLLQDCQTAAARVSTTEYKLSGLRKLIFSYNNCGKDTVEGSPGRRTKGAVQFFPLVGFVTTNLKFTGDDPTASQHYPASASPVFGAGIIFILPHNRQQLSFVVDVDWQHFQSVSSAVEQTSFSFDETGHVEYSVLNVDVLFRYRYFTGGRVRPFLEIGLSEGAAIGMKAYQTFVGNQINYSYTEPFLGGATRKDLEGWIGGAGLATGRWNLEARFQAGAGIADASGVASPTKSWYALLSYSF